MVTMFYGHNLVNLYAIDFLDSKVGAELVSDTPTGFFGVR